VQDDGQLAQVGREVVRQLLARGLELVQDLLGLIRAADIVPGPE
jgi:hypothetical protein